MKAKVTVAAACALFALAAVGFAGCGDPADEAGGAELVVAAAANLTEAFGEVGRRFTQRTGVRVVNSFGATADLARQIEHGAPFDVFAAADTEHVDALAARGLLAEGTRAVYARGRLVLWLPRGESPVARVEDLPGAAVSRVAVAKPDLAPYGRAAVEAMRALHVWARVEPKVVYAQSVAQAKQFAATGNADAAFLPRSLVKEGEGRFIEVDESLHRPIDQAVGVVRASRKQEAARRFVEFLLSEEGKSVLESFGYAPPAGR
ncbi:MAG: molybdate ABC transporter substrate-binding protein [Acidobacteriota bacterium]|nr:molybdate ABC transporter substrate-binding protein [Acidobacteriota bacterium]